MSSQLGSINRVDTHFTVSISTDYSAFLENIRILCTFFRIFLFSSTTSDRFDRLQQPKLSRVFFDSVVIERRSTSIRIGRPWWRIKKRKFCLLFRCRFNPIRSGRSTYFFEIHPSPPLLFLRQQKGIRRSCLLSPKLGRMVILLRLSSIPPKWIGIRFRHSRK